MEKEVLPLDGSWEFKEFPETARRMRDLDAGRWLPAGVPSSIYTCLIHAGKIDASNLAANPEQFGWVSRKSWIFRKEFDAPPSLLNKEHLQLCFEGLDTISQLWLNDKLIGKTDNMFIPHAFDITERLKPTGNVLYVKFLPALAHAERLMQRYGKLSEHHFGDIRRSYIRKAQYQFGSALGPALPGCGIFRSVRIEGADTATLDWLHLRTVDCSQHEADVRIAVTLNRLPNVQTPLDCRLHLTGGGLDLCQALPFAAQEEQHSTLIHIERPFLWWPKGYGVQHLYHLKAELYQNDRLLDAAEADFGIRTVRVNRSPDETGNKFQFEVNEEPVYIKGANWMPLSVFPGTATRRQYESLLEQAANANLNMLRVWGGGMYEDPAFYRLCDTLGILVWQDFMFASAYYPDREWFTASVEQEARTVIRQLRNHPCLALWCGNSRIDSLHEAGHLGTGRKFYGKAIYHDLLPGLLRELDPDREYIPTTPFSESPSASPNDPASGTAHRWDVWNNYAGTDDYVAANHGIPRFVTEFGFQSIPSLPTLSVLGVGNGISAGAPSLEKHNYQPDGQQRIARYVAEYFTARSSLKEAVWQSQVVQARAMKKYVEYLRQNNTINTGCLFWTFNESTPSIGFCAMDACGNPKALYYYARRFFAPILITLTQSEHPGTNRILVVNDGQTRITATLQCRLLDLTGKMLDQICMPVALSPLSRSGFYTLPKSFSPPAVSKDSVLHLLLSAEHSTLAENVYFFAADKYLPWHGGGIDLTVVPKEHNTWQVTLNAQTVMADVQVIPPRPAQLSDNFFTLIPASPKDITLRFQSDAPDVWTPLEILSANQCRQNR